MSHRTALPPAAAEPPTTLEVAPDVVALLQLPSLEGLTDDQVRGANCVWCKAGLTADTAVDFGEQQTPLSGTSSVHGMRWYPRACPKCTADRAHRGLFDHAPSCEQCVDAAERCETSRALYRLVRDGRR
ncbi:hypothetical protein ACFWR9_20580 [Streptomyces sp. NPDC058534]|uniref:hypothetical protein n=1 Tax=Streptomyces sp. NPDC058534 TaxID=3346541 RepID=UPI003653F1E2